MLCVLRFCSAFESVSSIVSPSLARMNWPGTVPPNVQWVIPDPSSSFESVSVISRTTFTNSGEDRVMGGGTLGFGRYARSTDVDWDEDSRKDFLESIVNATDRMARLVDDILDLARLETGGHAGEHRRLIPLGGPIRAGVVQSRAFLRDHRLRVRLPRDLPPVFAEPGQIERVVTNLVENAARYSPPGTPISVEARSERSNVVVWVVDRGPGIPNDRTEQIFEKFVRLPPRDGPAPPGTSATHR